MSMVCWLKKKGISLKKKKKKGISLGKPVILIFFLIKGCLF